MYLFTDERRAELLRVLSRQASNPDLSFSWYDAAVLSQRIRQQAATSPLAADVPAHEVPSVVLESAWQPWQIYVGLLQQQAEEQRQLTAKQRQEIADLAEAHKEEMDELLTRQEQERRYSRENFPKSPED